TLALAQGGAVTAIFTASWPALHAADKLGLLDVLPVRISQGAPRYWSEAERFPALPDLMPTWQMIAMEVQAFWDTYLQRLNAVGFDVVRDQLGDLVEAHGRIALACHERDVSECHRGPRGLSGWLETHGMTIAEWQAPGEQLDFFTNINSAGTGAGRSST